MPSISIPWIYPHPFLYITISFITGIITAYYTPFINTYAPHLICLTLTSSYLLLCLFTYLRNISTLPISLLGLIVIFSFGYLTLHITQPQHNPLHLIHHREPIQAYKGIIITSPQTKNNKAYTTLKMQYARTHGLWQPLEANIRLTSSHHALSSLHYGDHVLILGTPTLTSCSVNQAIFNHKNFLAKQNIHHTHLIHPSNITKLSSLSPYHPIKKATQLKHYIIQQIKHNLKDPPTQGLVLALTLGMRQELQQTLQKSYISTGVMHVLAISGLHIGLLYLILLLLLRLLRLHKTLIAHIPILIILWTYAYITGLSPSVIRAVTMLSLLLITKLLKRPYQHINTLAISAFLLTLYNPYFLFQPSFQLSYTAVLGILCLYPKLYQAIAPLKLPKKIKQSLTLSLSAQLATLPLTLHYFSTFPTYFLLANLIVLPIISLILILAILIILTSSLPSLSTAIGQATTQCTTLLHQLLHHLQQLPASTIPHPKVSLTTLILLYLIAFALWRTLVQRKPIHLLITLSLTTLLPIQHLLYHHHAPPHLFYYSHPTQSTLGLIHHQHATLLTHAPTKKTIPSDLLARYLQQKNTKHAHIHSLHKPNLPGLLTSWHGLKLITLHHHTVLWLHQPTNLTLHTSPRIPIDLIIIENNALLNLNHLLNCFTPSLIVLGSTNTPELLSILHQQALKHHIPCLIIPTASQELIPLHPNPSNSTKKYIP